MPVAGAEIGTAALRVSALHRVPSRSPRVDRRRGEIVSNRQPTQPADPLKAHRNARRLPVP
jgi:hypothetical protein